MQIILREDVPHLGNVGQIVNVKPGYARNYLLPQGLAVMADEKNVRRIEHEQRLIQKRLVALKGSAQELGDGIDGQVVTIHRKVGEQDKLYGSVTTRDVEEALKANGLKVERRQIRLGDSIKDLGVYQIAIRLHPEVVPHIKLWVVAE